ncbi:tripartite tricarboxylate transporter substrate binding protein [Bordetella sp. BOR01]|uniref:Bug family tripartite tricarboxylate transporter substrate binding protein n=1 Tax=Bordetella sp. BOR01 TaxID=2854779 RepID=UPI001C43EAAB|nr:tripartite tricarboxylate transporter substrate binding protein [Bordetella sp. BOR01]MBV7486675.1 tripartite tricarboxylate transporter substrate binding protein [Bordetella sp. BOR01]
MSLIHRFNRHASALAAAALLYAAAAPALAAPSAAFPSQPIRIIVPFSPGTGSDVFARTVGDRIGQETGQPVVIENKVGASGVIGTMAVARAPADGYTILMVANPFVIAAGADKNLPYDPLKDFVPIAKVATVPIALTIYAGLGINTVQELVAYAKQNPGKLSFASSGAGTPSQIEMEIFKDVAGIDMVEVPYKSSSQALTDVMSGNIAIYPAAMPLALSQIDSGRIRVLGLFSDERSKAMPQAPTVPEALGNPKGYVATPLWYGFVARAGTPPQVVERLRELVLDAMASKEASGRLISLGAQPVSPSNAEFSEQLRAERDRTVTVTQALSIK